MTCYNNIQIISSPVDLRVVMPPIYFVIFNKMADLSFSIDIKLFYTSKHKLYERNKRKILIIR